MITKQPRHDNETLTEIITSFMMNDFIENVYTYMADTSPVLLKACIDNEYFVTMIERYAKDSVPVTVNQERVDKMNRYLIIDTTKNIRDFTDYDKYESYSHKLLNRFYDIPDKDWGLC